MIDDQELLFVYGTLRHGFAGPMAARLAREARWVGPAWANGRLHRVADYPGFVPGTDGMVRGDLFALGRPRETLDWIDRYEECAPDFPQPHEYRRLRVAVRHEAVWYEAWTYCYARDVTGLPVIAGGDFLAAPA